MSGYLHPQYAQSLAEFGTPRELPHSGGWIMQRPISGFSDIDAMGCYPMFCCQDWSKLPLDLEEIGNDLVTLALVSDPYGNYNEAGLQQWFDVVIPFKEHYIIDLQLPINEIGSRRRRKYMRRALRQVQVEACPEPERFLDTWVELYNNLIKRHDIQGIRAFSRTSFAQQLSIPGTMVLQAVYQGEVIGAQLYFVQGDVVHCHLGAITDVGYEVGATYALDGYSIEYFSGKARWLDLGGGAGISSDGTDGLSQYKQGWATDTRTTYFCGRIFDQKKYAEIVHAKARGSTNYFPAYRSGEFG